MIYDIKLDAYKKVGTVINTETKQAEKQTT